MDSFGETCPVFLDGADKGTGGLRGGRELLRMLDSRGLLGEHLNETLNKHSYSQCLKDVNPVGLWHKEAKASGH